MLQTGWTDPYWEHAALRGIAADAWPEGRLDVAIVGGGLSGLITGLTAARLGMRVAIFEAAYPGAGASARNAGYITAGTTRSFEQCEALLGAQRAEQVWRFAIDAAAGAADFIAAENIDCGLIKTGRITLAVSPRHAEAQRRRAELERRRFGWPLTFIERAQLGEHTQLAGYYGGLLDPLTWGLDPARLVAGLVTAYRRAGGVLLYPTAVESISGADGRAVYLKIGARQVSAEAGFIALDGFTDRLDSPWARRVFSVGSALLVSTPLSQEVLDRLSAHGAAIETSEGFKRYCRRIGNRLLIGGRDSLLAPERQRSARQRLTVRSHRWLSSVTGELCISHAWSCRLGFTMNMLPVLARQGRLTFAGGYCGHGIPTSIALGRMAGEWLAGRGQPSLALCDLQHGVSPPRALHQPFLAAATLAFRCRDWIETRSVA